MKKQHIGIALAAALTIGALAACSPSTDEPTTTAQDTETTFEDIVDAPDEMTAFMESARWAWDAYDADMQADICSGYQMMGDTTAEAIANRVEENGMGLEDMGVSLSDLPNGMTFHEAQVATAEVFVEGCGF